MSQQAALMTTLVYCLRDQIDSGRLRSRLQRSLGCSPGDEQRHPAGRSTQHSCVPDQDQGQTRAARSPGFTREVKGPSRLVHVLHTLAFLWTVVDTVTRWQHVQLTKRLCREELLILLCRR